MECSRRQVLRALLAAAGALPLMTVASGRWPDAAAAESFARSELTVETARGSFTFDVELADTDRRRTQGLQFRRELAADAGMLFDFERPRLVSMWMLNTYISLDMLFIDAEGVIRGVAERTVPQTLTPIASHVPVLAVLEVRAGTAARLGLQPGDRVTHAIFRRYAQ